MTPLEALTKIKEMFAEVPPVAPAPAPAPMETPAPSEAPIEYKEYVLDNGAKVLIDKLEVGGCAVLVDESGNQTPAPAGEHILADGTKLVLDEMGCIMSIELPSEAPVETPVEAPAPMDMATEKIAQLEAELAELKKAVKCQADDSLTQNSKFAQAMKEMSDAVIELINSASTTPTETPKEKFNKHIESKEDKIKSFLSKYANK